MSKNTDKTKFELAVELERLGWEVSIGVLGPANVIKAKTSLDSNKTWLELQIIYYDSGYITREITHYLKDQTNNKNTQPHWLDNLPTPQQAAAKLREINKPENDNENHRTAEVKRER